MANPKGQPKQFWKEVAVAFPCGTCGAGPGHQCTTPAGVVTYLPHVDRTQQASANDWVHPDGVY
jgi:hypothetical protein